MLYGLRLVLVRRSCIGGARRCPCAARFRSKASIFGRGSEYGSLLAVIRALSCGLSDSISLANGFIVVWRDTEGLKKSTPVQRTG